MTLSSQMIVEAGLATRLVQLVSAESGGERLSVPIPSTTRLYLLLFLPFQHSNSQPYCTTEHTLHSIEQRQFTHNVIHRHHGDFSLSCQAGHEYNPPGRISPKILKFVCNTLLVEFTECVTYR